MVSHIPESGSLIDRGVIVGLGASVPYDGRSPEQTLGAALERLSSEGFTLVKRSRWWRSAAWPRVTDPPFVNAAAWFTVEPSPEDVLARLQSIEAAFGRRRSEANAPRTLDLDLIAYGRHIKAGKLLEVPHPRAAERAFVMGPLCDLDPRWRHPCAGATAAELFAAATVGRDARPERDDPAGRRL